MKYYRHFYSVAGMLQDEIHPEKSQRIYTHSPISEEVAWEVSALIWNPNITRLHHDGDPVALKYQVISDLNILYNLN